MIPYDKETIFNKAIEAIKQYRLTEIDKIPPFIGVSRTTLYDYFPKDSDKLNTIKEEILNVKIRGAVKMLNKFEDSDDKTLNIAYFKIVCSEEEWKRLSSSQTENKTELSTKTPINLKELFGFESDNP